MATETVPAANESACPLDCPDACSLERRRRGRPRRPHRRQPREPRHRRLHLRQGPRASPSTSTARSACLTRRAPRRKGEGRFERDLLGRGARPRRGAASGDARAARRRGDPALLLRRLERLAHPGHDRRPPLPPARRVAARAHGLRGARRGAPPRGLYGKMAGVAYEDYEHARLIVIWGVNPSASGIHLVPLHPRGAEARGAARRDRPAAHAARPARRPSPRGPPGHRPAWRSRCIRWLFASGRADEAFLAAHATGADELRRRAEPWTVERAAAAAGLEAAATSSRSPALRRDRARPSSAAAGASSATATAAPRWRRCSRCPPSPASSACAAAATR